MIVFSAVGPAYGQVHFVCSALTQQGGTRLTYGAVWRNMCYQVSRESKTGHFKTVSAAFHFAHSGIDCLDSCIKKRKKRNDLERLFPNILERCPRLPLHFFLSKIQLRSKLIMFMNIDSIQSEHVCVMCTRVVHIIMVSEVHGSVHSMYLLHRCFKPHLVM